MFKPRQNSSSPSSSSPPPIELVRQRAKHRLIGVALLVLAAVVLFPLLFDTQPRPIAVDIPIEIPSRKAVAPLAEPVLSDSEAPAAKAPANQPVEEIIDEGPDPKVSKVAESAAPASVTEKVPAPAVKVQSPGPAPESSASVAPKRVVAPAPVPSSASAPAVVAKSAPPSVTKPVVKAAAPLPKANSHDASRAQALLEGRTPATSPSAASQDSASAGRFIVQVGAFADASKAQQVRLKLEHAGLKTYTHVADTAEGKRIRVRLGPFASRAEAEKAAAKAKAQGLPSAILTL